MACVYRPWILDSRVHPVKEAMSAATGYSFPSGHTTNATTLFAGSVLRGKLSKGLSIVLIICLLLIGFSRNYLGVHSILDVIFAIIFTLIVLVVFSKLFDKLENNPNLDIIISVVGIIISIIIIIYALTKSYPLDYDAAGKLIVDPAKLKLDTFRNTGTAIGIFLCWPIERRFINFLTDGSLETKVLRFICGFIGLEFIITVILPLLGDSPLELFLQSVILMIFVIIIYPYIFKYVENRTNIS
ncbi:phosphatase PAP2 family protein [Methanobrevibacter sp.]